MIEGTSPRVRKCGIPRVAKPTTVGPRAPSKRRRLFLWIYGVVLTAAAVGLVLAASIAGVGFGPLVPTVVMALAAFVSEKQSVRLGPNLEASVGFLPGLFAVVALGPISAMVVVGVGLLATIGRPWERWLIWTSSRCFVYGIAALATIDLGRDNTLARLFATVGIASVIVISGEALSGMIIVHIRRSADSAAAHFLEILRVSVSVMIVYVPVIAGLVYVYTTVSSWTVVFFIGPAVAAQLFYRLYRNQQDAVTELGRAVRQLERVNLSFATALVTALDARDHYTAGHSATVAVYARDIAKQLGLPKDTQKRAHLCGLLHDIGKIGVPTGVLEKEGPLKRVERQAIENHAGVGATILGRIEGYEEIATAVRHHHERFDGTGYPDQQSGEGIAVLARLVAVADAYSAMTSDRPYRTALYGEEARDRLERGAGTQFDPEVVKAFVEVLERESESYAAGSDWDFEAEISKLTAKELGRSPALVGEASLV